MLGYTTINRCCPPGCGIKKPCWGITGDRAPGCGNTAWVGAKFWMGPACVLGSGWVGIVGSGWGSCTVGSTCRCTLGSGFGLPGPSSVKSPLGCVKGPSVGSWKHTWGTHYFRWPLQWLNHFSSKDSRENLSFAIRNSRIGQQLVIRRTHRNARYCRPQQAKNKCYRSVHVGAY